MEVRRGIIVSLLFALGIAGLGPASPAQAAWSITDSVAITGVSVDTSTGVTTISYNNTSVAGLNASIGFQLGANGREGTLQQQSLKSGRGTITLRPGVIFRAIKVIINVGGGQISGSRGFWVLVAPPTRSYYHTVTAAEATAQRVSLHVAAFALMLVPSSGVTQIAGAAMEGWSLGMDIAEGLGFKVGCPKAVKGQYVRTTQSQKLNESTGGVSMTVRVTTWASYTAYVNGKAAICDSTDSAGLR